MKKNEEKTQYLGGTIFFFLNGRSMISQEFMARDLLARILTQFRWWVHNESVIFVKSHLICYEFTTENIACRGVKG